MINLLPPEEKKELLLKKKKKVIFICQVIIFIPLLCLALILLSIKFYLLGEINSQKTILENAKRQYETPDFLHFKGIVQHSNETIAQLKPFYQPSINESGALQIISAFDRPQNLYFTNVTLSKDKNQQIKANIFGFSNSREDLLLFQKTLQANNQIENMSFSPESWVNSQNVSFNLTFNFKK